MKLFYAPNTIAVASVIALNETGLPHELIKVNFASAEQTKANYHRINPKGRVPALVSDDGILTETSAILEYIAALKPDLELMPTDPWQAAQVRSVMAYLASTMHVAHAHKMRGTRWAKEQSSFDDMRSMVPATMSLCCQYLEENVFEQGPFVMGAHLTLADPWLYAISLWLEGDGVTVSDYPRLSAFLDGFSQRRSVLKAKENGAIL
ncbi:MAG: glutathione S-transferase family protein [Pseudoruegeria sp.]